MGETQSNQTFQKIQRAAGAAVTLAGGYLACGGSVGAAEQCARDVCRAYGACDIQVCAVPNMLAVSACCGDLSVTRMTRIYAATNDLFLLEEYGRLHRAVLAGMSLESLTDELARVRAIPRGGILRAATGGVLACGAFCAFFGGRAPETAMSALVGAAVNALSVLLSARGAGGVARTFLLSLCAGALSLLLCAACTFLGITCSSALVMLGSVMILIPGLSLCNALKDILSGDLFSGIYRTVGGLSATAAIVAGYALSGKLLLFAGIGGYAAVPAEYGNILKLFLCAAGSAGFCIGMNARPARTLCCALAALITFAVSLAAEAFGLFAGCFAAAAAAQLLSSLMSAAYKAPAGVFLTPAVIPLLPGASLYLAAEALLSSDFQSALVYGSDGLYILLSLAAGLAAASVAVRILRAAVKRARTAVRNKTTAARAIKHKISRKRGVQRKRIWILKNSHKD